ncbi:MAG: PilZ domain-containing protein [Blastochloris sp.]|nr:PilZ domain-containing protein [Blastochloris sp.]
MSDTQLKLTDSPASVDVLPFERRREPRRRAAGQVTALRTASTRGQNNRICSLRLTDMSDSGLGAVVAEPVEIGSTIAVFFPPHGPERGFDLYGQVVRCQNTAEGHELGIRFDARAAA